MKKKKEIKKKQKKRKKRKKKTFHITMYNQFNCKYFKMFIIECLYIVYMYNQCDYKVF